MRAAAAWACVAAWAWLSFMQAGGTTEVTPWRPVLVDPSRLNKSTATEVFRALRSTLCGMACVKEAWCSLWCLGAPTGCRLTSYTVSASYVPVPPTGVPVPCYTKMKKDLAVGAVPTSSYVNRMLTLRKVSNLVDGYYGHNIEEVGLAEDFKPDGAWFQFDLLSFETITEVVLTAQPDDDAGEFFRDIEVRAGVSVPSPGVFSPLFTLLGTFAGPAVKDERVVLRPPEPLEARYVTIQRKSSGDLQVAHLEIY